MTTLETTNRTFNKAVKTLISTNLTKVVSFKKVNNREARLIGEKGTTIAMWKQTNTGSKVILLSDY